MRQPFAILLALGLLSAAVGCHTHGACDCDLGPIGHEGPPPLLRPVPAPVSQAPVPATTEPVDKTASSAALEPVDRMASSAVIEPVPEAIEISK